MDELPELPFEKVLSYLSLKDRLKARAVSRRWYHKINSFRPKCLCYSSRPSDFIWGKIRWVSGAFAKNFISSNGFAPFFDTFSQTILSSLKHLRLCNLHLSEEDSTAFARILNSFAQLEHLDIIWARLKQQGVFKLNLPTLTSLHVEYVSGARKLSLEAPRLRDVELLDPYGWGLRVDLVHGESVERLLDDRLNYTEVKKLKNLKVLYIGEDSIGEIDSTFLSSLQQLKEIHLQSSQRVSKLFEEKQRLGRADLKIYLCGLLLNGPVDPAIHALDDPYRLDGEGLVCLAENRTRLADQIPCYRSLEYLNIQNVIPGTEIDLLKRCTRLKGLTVYSPVEDVERFLNLLKNCKNIGDLNFRGDQPQDLFDRLPEHSVVQKLTLHEPPSDLAFIFRLKHLIKLDVDWSIDSETVRRAFEELSALSYFTFRYGQKKVSIDIDQVSKQFKVSFGYRKTPVSDLNAAIEFIFGEEKPNRPKKRKADALK